MKYSNNRVDELKIAYIGGGSRGWAWTFMSDLALEPNLSGTVALYDIDQESATQNAVIGKMISANEKAVGKWDYVATHQLSDALTGADFVIISILPGTFDEMESDVHLPERLGIYQSVGDTAGPGGFIRALRTIPDFVMFAKAIEEHCPDAWVINFTNPMSICIKTLYHTFPKIKAFGCCHEVFGTQDLLKQILRDEHGITNVERDEIKINVLGINHFTWLNYATYKGMDLFPIYCESVAKNFEHGINQSNDHWANSHFNSMNRVKFDLFQKYGLIAAAGDRHLAEFMPGNTYLKDPATIADWNFSLTKVAWRKEDLAWRIARGKRLASGEEKFEIHQSGEEAIILIKALCGLGQVITNVNIPNAARQISNFPCDAVVETNALFERDAIRPLYAGAMPENIYNLMEPHIKAHDLILQAALTFDRELVVQAFMDDPLVKGKATLDETRQLVDDMINATITKLPQEWCHNGVDK